MKQNDMHRVNAVIHHPLYQKYYAQIRKLEEERIFCCHQMNHLLDVARIAYIHNLERNLGFEKELLYTAAVLHDIGKSFQYEQKIPHEIAGEKIAAEILDTLPTEAHYTEEEKKLILLAIRGHRKMHDGMEPIEALMYESDKQSRMCFACIAEEQCNWNNEKKNREIDI